MIAMAFKPQKVVIDTESAHSELAQLLSKPPKNTLAHPKQTLCLTTNRGPALRPCPGTKEYICCGYQILHVGTGCPMECSYCILQAYLNDDRVRLFTNWEHIASAIEEASLLHAGTIFRLGTGEFTDSLCLDHLTSFTRFVVPRIQHTPNMVVEFKTKTDNVDTLLKLQNQDRVIVSFSVNSPKVIKEEELRTASLKQRLAAARRCHENGFVIGFHFDPLIHHKGWEQGYTRAVDMLFEAVDPKAIAWISLGCLRFMPHLKEIIRDRFPQSTIIYDEFITGLDGKKRYFHPIRTDMYNLVQERIAAHSADVLTYLCMESDGVWQKALGRSPGNSETLRQWLDERAKAFFPSLKEC
jgi:spore photoproduct lyase